MHNNSTERSRKFRKNNRLKYNEYHRKYRKMSYRDMLSDTNEYLFIKDYRKRKRRELATPPWADKKAIRSVYIQAALLEDQYGIEFVVVHEIPISHPKICGLHIKENLKIVTKKRADQLGRKFINHDWKDR